MKKFTGLLVMLLLAGASFASTLPFEETFDDKGLGDISGQNGWAVTGTGTAIVQNATAQSSSNALAITEATAANTFTGADTNVWITFWADPNPSDEPSGIATDAAAVFYVNTNDFLMAYNGTTATNLGVTVSDGWKKYEVFCDYSSKVWKMKFGETLVVDDFAFYGTATNLTGIDFKEAGTNALLVDSINITDLPAFSVAPTNISLSGDESVTVTNSEIVITNSSDTALTCTFTESLSWLTVPSPLTVAPGTASNLTVTAVYTNQATLNGTFTASYSQTIPFIGSAAFETFTVQFNVGARATPLAPLIPDDIVEISGGIAPGKYEPGETLDITITSTNDGAVTVNNITNTLSSRSGWSITPAFTNLGTLVTNTSTSAVFRVIIPSDAPLGTHTFDIQNEAPVGLWTNFFSIEVEVPNPKIFPLVPPFIKEQGGVNILNPDIYEPGEELRITVTNINAGDVTVTNILSTLSADPSVFTITPLGGTEVHPSMTTGQVETTIWQVDIHSAAAHGTYTFNVQNAADGDVWATNFTLDVHYQPIPSVTTNALTIIVTSGGTESGTITLTNAGNLATTFEITDNSLRDVSYTVSTQSASRVFFSELGDIIDPETTFTNWSGDSTATMPIGFDFPLYGTTYTDFSVSRYGAIRLNGTVVNANTNGTLPFETASIIAPFWGSTLVNTNSVRYEKQADKLVVSWGHGTGAEFQAWLYPDGHIRYLYEQGSWSGGAIGVQNGTRVQNVAYTPGGDQEGLLLTPATTPWVTHTPTNGTLAAQASQTITFTADAADQTTGTTIVFTNTVTWADSSTDDVVITVVVGGGTPGLDAPTDVTFIGPAGFISKTTMTLINTGDVALAYTITDTGAQSAGYAWTNTAFNWDELALDIYSGEYIPSDTDEGYSTLIPIGFEFPYYGTIYTQLSVGVNGGVSLGETRLMTSTYLEDIDGRSGNNRIVLVSRVNTLSKATPITLIDPDDSIPSFVDIPDRLIAPYWRDLRLDGNATISYFGNENRFVVTWENMQQNDAGADQTFQAILYKNGAIRFQYDSLNGSNVWPFAEIGLRDDGGSRTTPATLVYGGTADDPGTATYTTNYTLVPVATNGDIVTYTTNITVITTYNETVIDEAILIYPSERIVISVDPISSTIPVGEAQVVDIYGDARSLTPGGGETVPVSTTFDINHAGGANAVSVQFFATNSADAAYDPMALDSDGDGMSDAGELMFGSDGVVSVEQNPDGSRTLSWPKPTDNLSRTYTVWYTLNLLDEWEVLYSADNFYSYPDSEHNDVPVIYYNVTVH